MSKKEAGSRGRGGSQRRAGPDRDTTRNSPDRDPTQPTPETEPTRRSPVEPYRPDEPGRPNPKHPGRPEPVEMTPDQPSNQAGRRRDEQVPEASVRGPRAGVERPGGVLREGTTEWGDLAEDRAISGRRGGQVLRGGQAGGSTSDFEPEEE